MHLASWPSYDEALIDDDLEQATGLARRLVELGRAARAEAKMKTRQPLRRALVSSAARSLMSDDLAAEVAAELNIGSLESFTSAGDLVDHAVKGNFRTLGQRFAKQTPIVAAAIAAADASRLAAELAADGRTTVEVDGIGTVDLTAEDVIVSERPREGWSVVNEHGETIALDLQLTPELVRAGVAREFVRLVQEARRSAGLEVSDRIRLSWSADDEPAQALREHAAMISAEVLAVEMSEAGCRRRRGRASRSSGSPSPSRRPDRRAGGQASSSPSSSRSRRGVSPSWDGVSATLPSPLPSRACSWASK